MALSEAEEEKVRAILAIFDGLAPSLSSDIAERNPSLYAAWDGNSHIYAQSERVNYEGTLYTCLQTHTSQDDWSPSAAASLWAKTLGAGITDTLTSDIPDWVQPDSTNPYSQGARVKHSGKVWESIVANNVWKPGAAGTSAVWREVAEG